MRSRTPSSRTLVTGQSLDGDQEIVVVVPGHGGPLQVYHIRQPGELGHYCCHPGDLVVGEERAAGCGAVVDEQYPPATAAGGERSREPGGSRSDHHEFAVVMDRVVAVWVTGPSQSSLPVDAARGQSVDDVDRGRREHRFREGLFDLHDATGLLGPGRHDAARTSENHRVTGDADPGGEQGRSQGVTGMRIQGVAVERNVQPAAPVDPAVGRESAAGHAEAISATSERGGPSWWATATSGRDSPER